MRESNNCDICRHYVNETCELENEGCQTSMYEQHETNQDYFECMNDYSDGTMSV